MRSRTNNRSYDYSLFAAILVNGPDGIFACGKFPSYFGELPNSPLRGEKALGAERALSAGGRPGGALHLSISISASIKWGDNTYLAGKESVGQSRASATMHAAPRAGAPYTSSQARARFKQIFFFNLNAFKRETFFPCTKWKPGSLV